MEAIVKILGRMTYGCMEVEIVDRSAAADGYPFGTRLWEPKTGRTFDATHTETLAAAQERAIESLRVAMERQP